MNAAHYFFAILLATILLANSNCWAEERIWTHKDGRQILAELVSTERSDGVIVIKRADGQLFEINENQLALADLNYLKASREEIKNKVINASSPTRKDGANSPFWASEIETEGIYTWGELYFRVPIAWNTIDPMTSELMDAGMCASQFEIQQGLTRKVLLTRSWDDGSLEVEFSWDGTKRTIEQDRLQSMYKSELSALLAHTRSEVESVFKEQTRMKCIIKSFDTRDLGGVLAFQYELGITVGNREFCARVCDVPLGYGRLKIDARFEVGNLPLRQMLELNGMLQSITARSPTKVFIERNTPDKPDEKAMDASKISVSPSLKRTKSDDVQPSHQKENTDEFLKFHVPGLCEITYPGRFQRMPDDFNEKLNAEINQFIDQGWKNFPEAYRNKTTTLFAAEFEQDVQYAGIILFLMPPQVSQSDLLDQDEDFIPRLREHFSEFYREMSAAMNAQMLTDVSVKREKLNNGVHAINVSYVYKMLNGKIRSSEKRFVYTRNFTLSLSTVTSLEYLKTSGDEILKAITSFKPSGD